MTSKVRIKIILALALFAYNFLFSSTASNLAFAKAKYAEPATNLAELLSDPKKFLNKKIFLSGDFYSFSNLPLDYNRAMRSSKDYIGIILSRPDQKEIPLVELKLASPLSFFKDTNLSFEHGDRIEMKAKVFAIALGEPWLEVESIDVVSKADAGN